MVRTLILFVLFLFSGTTATSTADTDICTALELLPDDEVLFTVADSVPARFWNNNKFQTIVLTTAKNGTNRSYEGFKSVFDAQLSLKAAYGDSGLYILSSIEDDTFGVDYSSYPGCQSFEWLGWKADGVLLCFDTLSPNQLMSDPRRNFPMEGMWLSRSHVTYQINLVDSGDQSFLYQTSFNPQWDSLNGINLIGRPGEKTMFVRKWTPLQSLSKSDPDLIIRHFFIDSIHRAIEWRIPYRMVGTGIKRPASWKKEIACNFGYYDMEGPCTNAADELFWMKNDYEYPGRCFGRLVFGPLAVPVDSIARLYTAKPLDISPMVYTTRGRRVTKKPASAPVKRSENGIVLIRSIDRDGCIMYKKNVAGIWEEIRVPLGQDTAGAGRIP